MEVFTDLLNVNPDHHREELALLGREGSGTAWRPAIPWPLPVSSSAEGDTLFFPDFRDQDCPEDRLDEQGYRELALSYSFINYRGRHVLKVEPDTQKELFRTSFVWNLPFNEEIRQRILRGPPDVSSKMAWTIPTLRANASKDLEKRVFPDPAGPQAQEAAQDVSASTSSSSLTPVSASPRPSSPHRQVTGLNGGRLIKNEHKRVKIGWKDDTGVHFWATLPLTLGPLHLAIFRSIGASTSFRVDFQDRRFNKSVGRRVGPILEARIRAFVEASPDYATLDGDAETFAGFFISLAGEYRASFESPSAYEDLVSKLRAVHNRQSTKRKGDIISINDASGRLSHKSVFVEDGQRKNSSISVRMDDRFRDMYLPRLADILFSLNVTLHISVEEQEGQSIEQQEDRMLHILVSRALRCLLYYPVAHRLTTTTYEEALHIATEWMDILSMRSPQRPRLLQYVVRDTQPPIYAVQLPAPHDEARTTLSVHLVTRHPDQASAAATTDRIEDYLHDRRLGALDPHDCFGCWYLIDGPGELVSTYWGGGTIPGVTFNGVRLLDVVNARGLHLYRCALPGLAQDHKGCDSGGMHLCIRAGSGAQSRSRPFESDLRDLVPHEGRGPLKCHVLYTFSLCWYHQAVRSSLYAVATDRFFEVRWSSWSDVQTPVDGAQPPLSLDVLKSAVLPTHIKTAPVLTSHQDRASIVRFWLQGGDVLGRLKLESLLCEYRGVPGSVFDCSSLLDTKSRSLEDRRDLYRAALPSVDKEVHFLRDGSQHVKGNLKITDLQHNLAKGHAFLPFHADLLEVSLVCHQLISPLFPAKAEAMRRFVEATLSDDWQVKCSQFFVSHAQRRTHSKGLRQRSDEAFFRMAGANLIRGPSRRLVTAAMRSADIEEAEREFEELDDEMVSGEFELVEPLKILDLKEERKEMEVDDADEGRWTTRAVNPAFLQRTTQEAALKVIMEMEAHFGETSGCRDMQGFARNRAGLPVLVGDESWNWQKLMRFYADRLERSFVCEQARPVAADQGDKGPIDGVTGTHAHLSGYEQRSPVTLLLTHYHQQLKYGTGRRCHLTGLALVAEVGHPLKISLGHRVHGWKMWHGWSAQVPQSFSQFCEEANNVIFESWWANSWRRGWRCLRASLPRRLLWALDWLEAASMCDVVKHFTHDELETIRLHYENGGTEAVPLFRWTEVTDPLVDINVLSPAEQSIVWQRVYGSRT